MCGVVLAINREKRTVIGIIVAKQPVASKKELKMLGTGVEKRQDQGNKLSPAYPQQYMPLIIAHT